jgi:hypothetical protein
VVEVVPAATDEDVITDAAHQNVIAPAAVNLVVAGSAEDLVVAFIGIDAIIPAERVDDVRAIAAEQIIGCLRRPDRSLRELNLALFGAIGEPDAFDVGPSKTRRAGLLTDNPDRA